MHAGAGREGALRVALGTPAHLPQDGGTPADPGPAARGGKREKRPIAKPWRLETRRSRRGGRGSAPTDEERRAAAEANLRSYSEPVCVADDQFVGPLRASVSGPGEGAGRAPRGCARVGRAPAAVVPEGAQPLARGAGARSGSREALEIEALALPAPCRLPSRPPACPARSPGASAIVDADRAASGVRRGGTSPGKVSSSDELLDAGARRRPGPLALRVARRAATDSTRRPTTRAGGASFARSRNSTGSADVEAIHQQSVTRSLSPASKGDLVAAKAAAADLAAALLPSPGSSKEDEEDAWLRKEYARAREASAEIAQWTKPKKLAGIGEQLASLDAVIAERDLEALLGHLYASSAGDPDDLYYQDPAFVRRHAFHATDPQGRLVERFFARTELVTAKAGGGARVTGSVFGLADVLGQLHADQLPHKAGASIDNDDIRAGLVGPIRRMSVMLLDDDALEFVAEAPAGQPRSFAAALAGTSVDGSLARLERVGSRSRAAISPRSSSRRSGPEFTFRGSLAEPLPLRSLPDRPSRSSWAAPRPRSSALASAAEAKERSRTAAEEIRGGGGAGTARGVRPARRLVRGAGSA